MDMTTDLLRIFEEAGLQQLLFVKRLKYFDAYTPYSKILLAKNPFRLQALAIYVPKRKPSYLRVTYQQNAPMWLSQSMARWDTLKSQNEVGSSFDGDPLAAGRALADLLMKHL